MIIIYGEILIDMNKVIGRESFDYFVGGAPFNVAYSIQKSKGQVIFIGNVGNDLMGKYIKSFVKSQKIDDSFITIDNEHNTTLAFVLNNEEGERDFCFARKNGADYYLKEELLGEIQKANIVHVGSLMLSEDYGFKFAKKIINEAKKQKKIISFDINYRDDIFTSKEEAIKRYKEVYRDCDLIKISSDELDLFSYGKTLEEKLYNFALNNQKIFITLGKEGSALYQNNKLIRVESIDVKPVDTTGAGDAFYGTILSFIDQEGFEKFFNDEDKIKKYLFLANKQGAYATLKKGALSGVVSYNELIQERKNYEK